MKILNVFIFNLFLFSAVLSQEGQGMSIGLENHTIVTKNVVLLGDIIERTTIDDSIATLLRDIKVTKAPPPGEAKDVKLSFIRHLVRRKGIHLNIIGPFTIRVYSAHRRIWLTKRRKRII